MTDCLVYPSTDGTMAQIYYGRVTNTAAFNIERVLSDDYQQKT
jgi:hypothetical protein